MTSGSETVALWTPRVVENGAGPQGGPCVTILLSVHNGELFLNRQLDSFLEQHHHNWLLLWRDDGSTDASRSIMLAFQTHRGAGRCLEITEAQDDHLGITQSYLLLLNHAPRDCPVAFADQDDVWLPEKLSRAIAALDTAEAGKPALYCARQLLTDRDLNPLSTSPPLHNRDGVLPALAQNIATGCTVVVNAEGRDILGAIGQPPPFVLHDWWAYLAITAAAGVIRTDDRPVVLYRQHNANAVGAPSSWGRRAYAALRRGPTVFMTIFRSNIDWLLRHRDICDPATVRMLEFIQRGMNGSWLDRLRILRRLPGLTRRGWTERLVFRLWFLLG